MTKNILILSNITFLLIQVIMFILLLKRYIEEIKNMRKLTEDEIKNIIRKNKDLNNFLYKELNFSLKLIEENISDQNFIIKELEHCKNILDNFSNIKRIKTLIYDIKQILYKINIRIDCDIENNYYISGDYNLLKEVFLLIVKYYYKNNINIKVKKYGKFYNIEFLSNYPNKEIENDIVIDYITEIISKHKGIIKIKEKDTLKIVIIILPLEKKS